jgi:hypothetical protein
MAIDELKKNEVVLSNDFVTLTDILFLCVVTRVIIML